MITKTGIRARAGTLGYRANGLDSGLPVPILLGMLRSKRARFRSLDVPLAARNRAWDYLAKNYRLTDELRYQLTEGVNGHIGRCDEDAARAGMDWMRQRDRELGRTPRF
jgi:hypothetical protein